ncbi:MAG: hypothetical protein ACI8UO_004793 [Verrucomicrobiales bacterium]|jgi:hypothetical protein
MKKLLTLLITSFLALPLLAAETRTWTDKKGQSVEAEMVGLKDGAVLLKITSGDLAGRTVPMPLAILSAEDQKFVKANAPMDPSAAAKAIDNLVLTKLKSSYLEIKEEIKTNAEDPKVSRADKVKRDEELQFLRQMTYPREKTTDEQFVRRIYLDVAGRIPTYTETVEFLESRDADKRAKVIDQLLDGPAFTSHFFNYLSDLLRIREGIGMNGINGLRVGAYADWTKDQISANRPWDEWVTEMLVAQGHYHENPANGFLLTDVGMPFCNLSNVFTLFAGTEITCAQCHDHPFEEVYQMDFYKMAAYFGGTNLRGGRGTPEAQAASAKLKEYQQVWKERNAGKTPMPRFDRGLQDMLNAYQYAPTDTGEPKVQLPFDYKYDDADPSSMVSPATYFGEIVNLEEHPYPRSAFASWLASKDHPRFTINIVNRLWKFAFGLGQIEPVFNIPGHLDGQAQNYDLLIYLEEVMKSIDYDVKGFLRIIYNTDAYQRQANEFSPTLAQIDKGEYHFPSPVLRRMTAEQMWDSMVALSSDKPEAASNRMLESYQELMRTDWSTLTFDQAIEVKDKARGLGGIMMEDMMEEAGGPRGRNQMVRASEMRLPDSVGSLMFTFGQSDKLLIQNSNKVGSVPQVMMMMNGDLINKQMVGADKAIVKNARAAGRQSAGIEVVFLSILNRAPDSDEEDVAKALVTGDGDDADYTDLIWALLNSREFMFVQ